MIALGNNSEPSFPLVCGSSSSSRLSEFSLSTRIWGERERRAHGKAYGPELEHTITAHPTLLSRNEIRMLLHQLQRKPEKQIVVIISILCPVPFQLTLVQLQTSAYLIHHSGPHLCAFDPTCLFVNNTLDTLFFILYLLQALPSLRVFLYQASSLPRDKLIALPSYQLQTLLTLSL